MYLNNYYVNEKYCNDNYYADEGSINEWINVFDKLPPIGCWVLVTRRGNIQKPIEIACYKGARIAKDLNNTEYKYYSWTSGHGDLMHSINYDEYGSIIAWKYLPLPYKYEDL